MRLVLCFLTQKRLISYIIPQSDGKSQALRGAVAIFGTLHNTVCSNIAHNMHLLRF